MSRVKNNYLLFKALLLSALVTGASAALASSRDRDAWIAANLLGTTEAYESFLEDFPDSKLAELALEALADSFDTAAGGDTGGDTGGAEGGLY